MKPMLFAALTALSLAASGPVLAASGAHDHGHGATPATLQLNAGQKWETDAPLRAAMGEIRQLMGASLDAIHAETMSAASYQALAGKVEAAVGEIVANCKLPPAADAQLHLVVADLLAGTEQMAGKTGQINGAVKVIGALDSYGKFFDDAGFLPLEH